MELLRRLWPKVKMFGPLAAIVAVVVIVFVTDLAMDGGEGSEPENDAALGPGVAAASPLPPTETAPTVAPTTSAALTPTAAPTAVSNTVASMRDETRKADLAAIKAALAKYHDEEDEYPDTGGNIATACIFPDLDPLCDLDLDPLPSDPRGDPSKNGYWYKSDGKTYVVMAEVELPQNATPTVCPDNVNASLDRENLYCVTDK